MCRSFCYISAVLVTAILILASCKQVNTRPKSVGKPYEVLVVGDVDNIVDSVLSTPTPGLPQAEPLMDVIHAKQLTSDNNNFRTIIVVNMDNVPKKVAEAHSVEKANEFVDNQQTLYIFASDKKALKEITQKLRRTILTTEIAREQRNLAQKPNIKAAALVKKMFGKTMLIPQELTASKAGKDFLWLSNNTAEGMLNICFYYVDAKRFETQHDSIMQRNIQGTQKGDYLSIATLATRIVNKDTKNTTIRGIWRMRQEAMGGPFVTYILHNVKKQGKCLAVEAFLFAPEKEKRNRMRRLEAALYTLH